MLSKCQRCQFWVKMVFSPHCLCLNQNIQFRQKVWCVLEEWWFFLSCLKKFHWFQHCTGCVTRSLSSLTLQQDSILIGEELNPSIRSNDFPCYHQRELMCRILFQVQRQDTFGWDSRLQFGELSETKEKIQHNPSCLRQRISKLSTWKNEPSSSLRLSSGHNFAFVWSIPHVFTDCISSRNRFDNWMTMTTARSTEVNAFSTLVNFCSGPIRFRSGLKHMFHKGQFDLGQFLFLCFLLSLILSVSRVLPCCVWLLHQHLNAQWSRCRIQSLDPK